MSAVNMGVDICGVQFKNPVIAASGTFAFGTQHGWFIDVSKLGGISLKSLTPEKRIGNPPPRIAETASGIVNSVGLQNPGVDGFLTRIYKKVSEIDTALIANVAGRTVEDYIQVIEKLNDTELDMFELNISCPNVSGGVDFGTDPTLCEKVVAGCRRACDRPVIAKLTPNVTDVTTIARAAEAGGADAVSLINTCLGMAIDWRRRRPVLGNVMGGLSGPAIKPIALRMVFQVARAVSIPVMGIGGIATVDDVMEFLLAGATAVQVGTVNFYHPRASVEIVDALPAALAELGATRVSDIVGKVEMP